MGYIGREICVGARYLVGFINWLSTYNQCRIKLSNVNVPCKLPSLFTS